jgi:peptide deformylase
MIRTIVYYGHPVLREKGAAVKDVTPEIRALADDLIETMRDAEGVGLAAQQVGEPLQIAVVDVTGAEEPATFLRVNGEDRDWRDLMPLVFLNPRIEGLSAKVRSEEGCLSFPDVRAEIPRPESIRASVDTLDGQSWVLETDGLLARAIQHEADHLNGILFIDRMSSAAKFSLKKLIRSIQREGETMARVSG